MNCRLLPLLVSCPLLWAADNPRLEFATGLLAEARGDETAAAQRFERALAADPLAQPLVHKVAQIRLAAGDRAGAAKLYRDLLTARPDELGVRLAYVSFLEAEGRGDGVAAKVAAETLEAGLEQEPGHPELIRRLFQLRLAAGDLDRAKEVLEQLGEDPQSAMTYASLWSAAYSSDDEEARARLDQRLSAAADAEPRSPALARAASEHFRTTARLERAIEVLERHVEAAPASLALRTRLGILRLSAKEEAAGEEELREVLAIHPRQALAHQSLAKLHRLRGEPEGARFHASELLKIRGGSPTEFLDLAAEMLEAEDPRAARLLLEKAAFEHPAHLEIAAKLAIATHLDPATRERAGRRFREAEAVLGEQDPDPEFLAVSAEAMIDQGQIQPAEERLRAAIRSFPPEAKSATAAALRRLASLWEAENRNADAARALRQRAESLEPSKMDR